MKTKIQILLVFALATMFLSVAVANGQDNVDLYMAWWGSQNRHDRTIAVVDMYMEENPNVTITYEPAGWDDYWVKMNTQAAGGGLPCIMQQDYAYLSEWAKRDLLTPLDAFYEDGTIDVSNIEQGFLDSGKVGDSFYGLSLGSNSQTIILDVDAFEKAGLELPDPQWTWKDFEEIAMQLHDKLGIWGYGNPRLDDDQLWTSLMLGNGYMPFNADGTALGYDDDQPMIDLYEMMIRLQDAGAIENIEEILAETGGPEASPIVLGTAAMQYQWSNQVVAIFTAAGEDRHFALWLLPRPEGGNSENFLKPSMFFAIPATCENPAEAAKFISFFVNDPEANEILMAERGVPTPSTVREYLKPMLDEVGVATFDFLGQVATDYSPIFPPNPPGYSDIRNNILFPLVGEPILFGQMTPEEGVALFREEANALLSQNE